jgi:hypothetical protein
MGADADHRAFDALSENPRIGDIASLAWAAMASAIDGKPVDAAAQTTERATALNMTREDGATPFGNALELLQRGPEGAAERALARALAAHALATRPLSATDDYDRTVGDLVWLAARTPFDATGLLDRALSAASLEPFWTAMADRVRRADQGTLPSSGCGEGLVAAVALASSESEFAIKHALQLVAEVHDPKLAYVLAGGGIRASAAPALGEMAPRPRGPLATVLLGVTGIVILVQLVRLVARFALAYRRPAEVSLATDGAVRIRWRTQMLGRTLREHDVRLPRTEIARAVREVRYPALGLYAGLLALVAGSFVGVSTLVDGVRAGSLSVAALGLAAMTLGIALDFALSSLNPGRRGRCRMLVVPRRGSPLCVGSLDLASADGLLARIRMR